MPRLKDYNDRLQQRIRKLGTSNPICVCCGERHPMCLELHHIAGEKHHDDVSIVCRNCHRKLSDAQRDLPSAWLNESKDDSTHIGFYLLGLAELLALLIETLRRFAHRLLEGDPK